MAMFGETLAWLRKKDGLTVEEFSKKADISEAMVRNLESGYISPDDKMATKIADFFDVTVGYMCGTTNE